MKTKVRAKFLHSNRQTLRSVDYLLDSRPTTWLCTIAFASGRLLLSLLIVPQHGGPGRPVPVFHRIKQVI